MQLKWVHEPIWISKIKVIQWPWSRVIQIQHLKTSFSLETAKLIEAKFHMEPPWDGGTKVYWNGRGHMTNMATMPIYGKNIRKSTSRESKADDQESCYVASGARVLPSLFKWWPWVDLDLFYGKVKFGP